MRQERYRYTLTTELNTPLWKKILRFLRIIKPREEFELVMSFDAFSVGDIITSGDGINSKVIKSEANETV